MGLRDDLIGEVASILKTKWKERDGTVVPSSESVGLGNDAVKLDATVLYADLADSTKLVDSWKNWFAAEVYKSFLHCAAKIIRSENGVITAYDGDRVMAVFLGESKNTSAVRCALKIHAAVVDIIQPGILKQFPSITYVLKHVVGIDTSKLYVARTGVRGANDLVWVGRAANYAAKLAALPNTHQTYITKEVHDVMMDAVKFTNGQAMWEPAAWNTFDNRSIYRSTWKWAVPS